MSKKVKCKNCLSSSSCAYPRTITDKNYEYAKSCLETMENSIACMDSWNAKFRPVEHEQYCNKYKRDTEGIMEKRRLKSIYNLRCKIEEYERMHKHE